MADKFRMTVNIAPLDYADTARLGAGALLAQRHTDKELGKFVKLTGDSRYDLCAAGDEIEGQIVALEPATQDGYAIGSVAHPRRIDVVLDGLQATAGTGAIAIGDYVVVGTVVALGTALATVPKVTKATTQADAKNTPYAYRLVSASGTAVGSTGVIERL